MPKYTKKEKKSQRHHSSAEDLSQVEDSISTGGSSTSGSLGQDSDQETWQDKAREAVEFMNSKDTEMRLKHLNTLIRILRRHPCSEELWGDVNSILERAYSSVARGLPTEASTACLLLQIIQLSYPDTTVSNQFLQLLKSRAMDQEMAPEVRNACLYTFYFLSFVNLEEDIRDQLDEIQEKFFDDPVVHVTSIELFALLCTLLDDDTRCEILEEIGTEENIERLEGENATVESNIALGKLFSLLFESYHRLERTDLDFIHYQVSQLVNNIASYTTKSTSKKDAKEQRKMFRDFGDTINDGEIPVNQIQIRGYTLDIDGWSEVIRYNHLRTCLQSGIADHLISNDVVRNMLSIEKNLNMLNKDNLNSLEKEQRAKFKGLERSNKKSSQFGAMHE